MHALKGSNVTSLDLSFNSISNNGLEGICNQGFGGEVLILACNDIANPGLSSFAENLNKFPNLQKVDIRGNYFFSTSDLQESFELLKDSPVTVVIDASCGITIKLVNNMRALGVKIDVDAKVTKEE